MSARPENRRFERIRVRGIVQGVGFRPRVWHLAERYGVCGDVRNDAEGVLIRAWTDAETLDRFVAELEHSPPPLAKIEHLERTPAAWSPPPPRFEIVDSDPGLARTGVSPDAAVCKDCLADTLTPSNRRFRYPFTNCTHCGPRFTIVSGLPYDRSNTSMASFALCDSCRAEYQDPANRRFHAQPNACPVCGPRTELVAVGRGCALPRRPPGADDIIAVAGLLQQGRIVAIKGIGGFHLACDAGNVDAVRALRERKRRHRKPFALMAADLAMIGRYCTVTSREASLLQSPAAPIVILRARGPEALAANLAPGQPTLGFMLPYTPLHQMLLNALRHPVVMTSGNLSEEPQCTDNGEALTRLGGIADYVLLHDRPILNRVDDSVVRVVGGEPRLLRRARGYAPAPIALPPGFEDPPDLLAMGSQLKNTFCILVSGRALLSQHLGDLGNPAANADYRHNLELLQSLYRPALETVAVDCHPDYLSTRLGRELAGRAGLAVEEVQHHHAHIAACLVEHGVPLDTEPVLGLALDGLGYGADGTVWGGEFLLADYRQFRRLAALRPVAMPGGAQAIRQPWRNCYAQLAAAFGWDAYRRDQGHLELTRFLESKPLPTLAAMLRLGRNAPLASSCGRLFDAVAAAAGICREEVTYEGQAAIELEAAVDRERPGCDPGYPFELQSIPEQEILHLEPRPMWVELLRDLGDRVPVPVLATRFHNGLARALVETTRRLPGIAGLARKPRVVLTGGVFQNATLLELVEEGLRCSGFETLSHRRIPANDGGIALGQAAVAAARAMGSSRRPQTRSA